MAAEYNTTVDQGRTFTLVVEDWADDDGVVIDVTGYTVELGISDGGAVITGTATYTAGPPATSRISATVPVVRTTGWGAPLRYELALTSPTGTETSLLKGRLDVSPSVVP